MHLRRRLEPSEQPELAARPDRDDSTREVPWESNPRPCATWHVPGGACRVARGTWRVTRHAGELAACPRGERPLPASPGEPAVAPLRRCSSSAPTRICSYVLEGRGPSLPLLGEPATASLRGSTPAPRRACNCMTCGEAPRPQRSRHKQPMRRGRAFLVKDEGAARLLRPDECGIALDQLGLSMLGVKDFFKRGKRSNSGYNKGGEEWPFSKARGWPHLRGDG